MLRAEVESYPLRYKGVSLEFHDPPHGRAGPPVFLIIAGFTLLLAGGLC